jgi:tetratricopeptide (TPR) repeat protein
MTNPYGRDSNGDDDCALISGDIDFSGVDFDTNGEQPAPSEKIALEIERKAAFGEYLWNDKQHLVSPDDGDLTRLLELSQYLAAGRYIDALSGESAKKYFATDSCTADDDQTSTVTFPSRIRQLLCSKLRNVTDYVEVELLGIASFNLFLQLNYTGPSLDQGEQHLASSKVTKNPLCGINPHPCFASQFSVYNGDSGQDEGQVEKANRGITTSSYTGTIFHNAVLAELAVEGEWPCQVCEAPYLLLLARSILLPLSNPVQKDWINSSAVELERSLEEQSFSLASKLTGVHLWSARAAVAHGRLLQSREPPITLWEETDATFQLCLHEFCPGPTGTDQQPAASLSSDHESWQRRKYAATVLLEYGLAHHHFERPGMGRASFQKAKEQSGLAVSVTGSSGKRTKFQTKNTAQMLVEATSASRPDDGQQNNNNHQEDSSNLIREQKVELSEDEILLERIKFEDETKNEIKHLTTLDQAIVLSLCLDVKNSNPTGDDLTAEEMGAYLARVLDHHDDWMLYSTALLERAWLEFERTHGRERAILQMQALTDQHTNRLTLTQSTKKSIEESAPAQDRLRNLHSIVYPPRWGMLKDLADRYAKLGIFMSAAELYTQIELWDEVVECYRRSGRESKAEEIVRERLAIQETPRMWSTLGDLTRDPACWEKAIEMSRGRFSSAYIALAAFAFDKNDLVKAAEYYKKALELRPVAPAIWFRLGTISMQTSKWDDALGAFTRVVQLEPEEHEAWANVAAVHMRNKNPSSAYPALQEVSDCALSDDATSCS